MTVSAQLETFPISPRATGIDLLRSQIRNDLGVLVADATTVFRAGMLVQLDSDQKVTICDGTVPFGFAKYNKTQILYAGITGERIQLNGVISSNLANPLLLNPNSGGGVRVGAALTGPAYTEGSTDDYTVNYVNGQITRTAGSTIPDGSYVYVDYQYQLSYDDMQNEGSNYWNQINDVSTNNNKITVINDWALIFTMAYDPAETYSVNDILYAGTTAYGLDGLITRSSTKGSAYVGRVFQPPSAADPYLGIRYVGGMVS